MNTDPLSFSRGKNGIKGTLIELMLSQEIPMPKSLDEIVSDWRDRQFAKMLNVACVIFDMYGD